MDAHVGVSYGGLVGELYDEWKIADGVLAAVERRNARAFLL
jgi:hypothetical protein